jgi:predicted ATPase
VFTDLVGSTELLARLGEGAFDELRRAHFASLRDPIGRTGGEEVKTLGAAQAVECAVAMQQAVEQQARRVRSPLALRVGIALGDVSFEEGDVFGTPVVEAARLVASAGGGQILVTRVVRTVAGGRCGASFTDFESLDLKGLPDPVQVCRVEWEPLPESPIPLPSLLTGVGPGFVGRANELDRLKHMWTQAASGELRLALLPGEPRVGKTRLAVEFASRVHSDGATVLAGRCDEDLGVPYQPFVEALRHFIDHTSDQELAGRLGRYAGELSRLVPELAVRLPDLPPPVRADAETERFRLLDAVTAWLAAASADNPVLLILDSLQWAAKPTMLLLRHVVRSPHRARLMVVGTYRDTDLGHNHPLTETLADLRRDARVQWLALSGLDRAEAPQLTDRSASADADRGQPARGGFFVGREWELAQLGAALREVKTGRGQIFVVSGEAGIGKTRLVSKLADLAVGEKAPVLWGRCWEGEEAPTFWPWVQIFRALVFRLDPAALAGTGSHVPADLARLIPEIERFLRPDAEASAQPPSDQARFRLFDAATMLIRTAAADQPLVLILDDLHEADRTSLLLLEFIARQLQDIAVLVLATYREPEADLNPALSDTLGRIIRSGHRIHLVGLRRDEIGDFLSQGFEISLGGEALSKVEEGTGGNPFFLDELARRFVPEHQLRSAPGGGLEVPEGLRGPIRSRLAALPPDARALLALASVIGREFSFELLVDASGLPRDAVLAMLGRLAALRLVDLAGFGLGPYRFAHALVRETVYQDLPAEQRWGLHRRIGHSIENLSASNLDGYLDQLAHHFSEAAALGEIDRAIDYSQRAGQRATRQFGFDEAIGHYRRALELTQGADGSAPTRFDLTLALGDAQWCAAHVGEASETFGSAAFLAREMGDRHRLAEAALRVGEVGYGGVYMQAWSFDALRVELLEQALAALGEEESLLKVRVLARLSTALYFSPFESSSQRESLSRASVDLARRLGDGLTLAYALNARHLAVWGPDNLEERLGLAVEIVDLARQARDVSLELTGRVWRLADLLETGDVPGADGEIEAFEALARRVAYPHFVAYAFMFRALQAMLRGQFAEAEANALRSLALGEQIGDANLRLSHHVQMTWLRAMQGRVKDTASHLDSVQIEHPAEVGRTVRRYFLWVAGDRAGISEALPSMAAVHGSVPPAFRLTFTVGLAIVSASAGAVQERADIYDFLRPYEHRWVLAGRDAVACLWPVAYTLGVLAASQSRFDGAAAHFEVALEAAERVGARPTLAMTQAAYGTMLARRGGTLDRQRATQLLAAALKAAEELGMSQLWDEVVAARAGLPAEQVTEDSRQRQSPGSSPEAAVFRSEGEYWTIAFEHVVVRMKDAKGFRYLRTLLAAPGREFHVLDLAGGAAPSPARGAHDVLGEPLPVATMGGDKVLDSRAKTAYRARIEELREDLEEAEDRNDLERASRVRAEMDFIVAELAQAVGLGGRDRETASAGERARSAVSKSLHASLKHIEKAHPTLGAHLATTIRTGYFCSYKPDPRAPVEWRT